MESFSQMAIFWTVFLVAVLVIAFKGVKQVDQSKVLLVERFGKYSRTLGSGINFVIPFIDKIKYELDVSEKQISIANQNVTSSDNVRIILDMQAFYRITDAAQFKYRIEDGERAVRSTIDATVRALVGRRTLDQINADRLRLAAEVAEEVRNTSAEWGVSMSRVEITDVNIVDQAFADSMRREAQAERERRGTIIEAEANAQTIKLSAEAEALKIRVEADALFYKAQKEAEAIRVTAEAQAWALSTKGASLEAEGAKFAQQSEIMRAQVDALQSLGGAENAKIVVIPSDLVQTAAGLAQFLRK